MATIPGTVVNTPAVKNGLIFGLTPNEVVGTRKQFRLSDKDRNVILKWIVQARPHASRDVNLVRPLAKLFHLEGYGADVDQAICTRLTQRVYTYVTGDNHLGRVTFKGTNADRRSVVLYPKALVDRVLSPDWDGELGVMSDYSTTATCFTDALDSTEFYNSRSTDAMLAHGNINNQSINRDPAHNLVINAIGDSSNSSPRVSANSQSQSPPSRSTHRLDLSTTHSSPTTANEHDGADVDMDDLAPATRALTHGPSTHSTRHVSYSDPVVTSVARPSTTSTTSTTSSGSGAPIIPLLSGLFPPKNTHQSLVVTSNHPVIIALDELTDWMQGFTLRCAHVAGETARSDPSRTHGDGRSDVRRSTGTGPGANVAATFNTPNWTRAASTGSSSRPAADVGRSPTVAGTGRSSVSAGRSPISEAHSPTSVRRSSTFAGRSPTSPGGAARASFTAGRASMAVGRSPTSADHSARRESGSGYWGRRDELLERHRSLPSVEALLSHTGQLDHGGDGVDVVEDHIS